MMFNMPHLARMWERIQSKPILIAMGSHRALLGVSTSTDDFCTFQKGWGADRRVVGIAAGMTTGPVKKELHANAGRGGDHLTFPKATFTQILRDQVEASTWKGADNTCVWSTCSMHTWPLSLPLVFRRAQGQHYMHPPGDTPSNPPIVARALSRCVGRKRIFHNLSWYSSGVSLNSKMPDPVLGYSIRVLVFRRISLLWLD
jgi:hypothetical protein